MISAQDKIYQEQDIHVSLGQKEYIVHARHWPGSGRPLVLLHGFLDSSSGWDTFAQTTHRPCWALDLPGFGSSTLPSKPRLSEYAALVAEAINVIGLQKYVLVGHSMGGAVATLVAELHKDRVQELVLIAPAGFSRVHLANIFRVPVVGDLADDGFLLLMRLKYLRRLVYQFAVANGTSMPENLDKAFENTKLLQAGTDCALRALAYHDHDREAFWRRPIDYTGMVYVLWGTRDLLLPLALGHARKLKAAIPQSQLETWHMGHHPQVEKPQELAKWMEDVVIQSRPHRKNRRR